MRIHPSSLGLGLFVSSVALLLPSLARAASHSQCFSLRQWAGGWKSDSAHRSIYIRLLTGEVYRLELAEAYPMLTDPFATLYDSETVSLICSHVDWHLTLSDHTGVVEPLIVRGMVLLTPAQVKALPKDERP